MAFRYIAPALAIAGTAAAACSGTITVSNSADAAALTTCQTFSGSIAVATSNADDIALDGIRRITGSLTLQNNNKMASLSASSLSQIDDSFTVHNVQLLSTLNFPMLTAVDTVDWEGLPTLSSLSFTAGLQQVQSLSIQNTVLSSLDGISLMEVDTLFVVNNFFLNDIEMPLGNVSNAMTLSANGDSVIASFPDLQWASNVSLQDCSSIDISSLSAVNASLSVGSSTMQSLSMPNLTTVGGSLSFIDNNKLTNISAPSLRQMNGGLIIANNTALQQVNGFPRLANIGGAIDMTGNFKSVTLPDLNRVRGAFNIQSTNQAISSSCNHFQPLSGGRANIIGGKFDCRSTSNPKGLNGNGSGGTGTSSGSSSSSSSPANTMYISGATGIMGVVAAIFGML